MTRAPGCRSPYAPSGSLRWQRLGRRILLWSQALPAPVPAKPEAQGSRTSPFHVPTEMPKAWLTLTLFLSRSSFQWKSLMGRKVQMLAPEIR